MKAQEQRPSESLQLIAALSRADALMMRRFESSLPGGLGFNEFMILFHLHQTPDRKLRRVDLADRLGVTSSGVTRLVAPMEKLGIVKREESPHDGRVVYVAVAPGGKRLFTEALETAEYNSEKIIPTKKAAAFRDLIASIHW